MFRLRVHNPRSQNECSRHYKGSLDLESGILCPRGVIYSKTLSWAWGPHLSEFRSGFIITGKILSLSKALRVKIQVDSMILEHSPSPTSRRQRPLTPWLCSLDRGWVWNWMEDACGIMLAHVRRPRSHGHAAPHGLTRHRCQVTPAVTRFSSSEQCPRQSAVGVPSTFHDTKIHITLQ